MLRRLAFAESTLPRLRLIAESYSRELDKRSIRAYVWINGGNVTFSMTTVEIEVEKNLLAGLTIELRRRFSGAPRIYKRNYDEEAWSDSIYEAQLQETIEADLDRKYEPQLNPRSRFPPGHWRRW
jgi:hypothetical protein